jgi:hypothetical protein
MRKFVADLRNLVNDIASWPVARPWPMAASPLWDEYGPVQMWHARGGGHDASTSCGSARGGGPDFGDFRGRLLVVRLYSDRGEAPSQRVIQEFFGGSGVERPTQMPER